jgi:hypothetical protein
MHEYKYLYKYGPASPAHLAQPGKMKKAKPCRCGSKNGAVHIRQTRYVEIRNDEEEVPCDEKDVTTSE